jgi:hypothetical protein
MNYQGIKEQWNVRNNKVTLPNYDYSWVSKIGRIKK